MSGNSFAAPVISGIVTLIKGKNNLLGLSEVRRELSEIALNHRLRVDVVLE